LSEHSSILAHHFDDLEQQHEADTLGMWTFLATEVMFFGGVLAAYALYRHYYHSAFVAASGQESIVLGCTNTVVLLCSSLTMVLAVHSASEGKRRGIIFWLFMTIVLSLVFFSIKAIEYGKVFDHGLFPGLWNPTEEARQHLAHVDLSHVRIFFCFYFACTGLHALHMIIGVAIILVLMYKAYKGRYTAEYNNPIEMFGLYWHFVDIVWIFLFPLFYLVDRSGAGH
jgi:cytochrome c oxidase subunit III